MGVEDYPRHQGVIMGTVNFDTIAQIVTVLGGAVALLLAALQIVETYLDVSEKLRKRRSKKRKVKQH